METMSTSLSLGLITDQEVSTGSYLGPGKLVFLPEWKHSCAPSDSFHYLNSTSMSLLFTWNASRDHSNFTENFCFQLNWLVYILEDLFTGNFNSCNYCIEMWKRRSSCPFLSFSCIFRQNINLEGWRPRLGNPGSATVICKRIDLFLWIII